jgi:hypothetical protein
MGLLSATSPYCIRLRDALPGYARPYLALAIAYYACITPDKRVHSLLLAYRLCIGASWPALRWKRAGNAPVLRFGGST